MAMALLADSSSELHEAGENVPDFAAVGSLSCVECGYAVAAAAISDDLPHCPACGGTSFQRRSIFERPTVDVEAVVPASAEPGWLDEVRAEQDTGPCLAFNLDGEHITRELPIGWTRIGRSATADVRLDDPTVSRRHALIVRTAEGLRALDDRSLNGLFVNGRRVEWARLADGDELEVGRFRLYVVEA
jgi:hypothetical protein